jgi:tRNA (cytidine/uridine-2'-O-)-methyltransferase
LGEPFFVSPDAERTIWDVSYPDRVALLFGSETSGLPASIRESRRDRLVSIPMEDGATRSLNLSTTVGIAVYEVLRQRRRPHSPPR